MSAPVFIYLTPPDGLVPLLAPARLAAFREWFWRENTEHLSGEALREAESDEELKAILDFVDHLLEHGAEALRKPAARHAEAMLDLLDELSDFFTREEPDALEGLALATDRKPTDADVRASYVVVAEGCPTRTFDLWRHLVWGRAPDRAVAEGIGLRRNYPSLGYWTAAEVKQVRDDLREHLSGTPDYKPVRTGARFKVALRRMLSLSSRGQSAPALDAISHAVDRAAREGAGLLFAR
ncbi:hypothetical protein A176_007460 [Myxococcus hansupus]|uniref:Uncharacterized protein n=1 Tax=Pseudomyxococcus hansupus TaxID=1297742 RepID=A0A0H4X9A0_9BACT|nr:hypothetical protein [Myxococcus hansupus]AKQ70548.1 hypothetical protein A176_007460 [Myxococcus hansupus]